MKRLRHPVRAIREPFGTAGLVVACVALVLALTGAAFAAAGLTGKQKKEVTKIAKKYAGKPGAPGAAGPAGPQGPAGAAGKDGANGTNGTDGADGKEGKEGKEGEEGEEGEEGKEGPEGKQGPEGSAWTAGGTLPAGAQLTGIWSAHADAAEVVDVPISFPIKLASVFGVNKENVYFGAGNEEPEIEKEPGVFEKTEFQKHCEKSAGNPIVAPKNIRTLCVYLAPASSEPLENFIFKEVSTLGGAETPGASRAGGILKLEFTKPGHAYGSFAVSGG